MKQFEGTNQLITDNAIEQLQMILRTGSLRDISWDDTQSVARDLIALYEVLAEDDE